MPDLLLVLDSLASFRKIKSCENFVPRLKDYDVRVVEYENALISFFQRTKFCGKLLARIFYWAKSLMAAFWIFLFKNKWPEGVVFINPIVGIFYCFFCSLFRVRRIEKIVVAGFLFEDKKSKIYLYFRAAFVVFSYKSATQIVVYGSREVGYYSSVFPTLKDKFVFVPYGRDFDQNFVSSLDAGAAYIASGGASNRDYLTLLKAVEYIHDVMRVDGFPVVKIATRPAVLSQARNFGIEVLYDIPPALFGDFLSNSVFVVLPLADVVISAGHMALLEAMSLSKPVLISDIESVRDYIDGAEAFFYRAGDYVVLAESMVKIWSERNELTTISRGARLASLYKSKYTQSEFLKRILV